MTTAQFKPAISAALFEKFNQNHRAINSHRMDQVSRLSSEIECPAVKSSSQMKQSTTSRYMPPGNGLSLVDLNPIMYTPQCIEPPVFRGIYPECSGAKDFFTLSRFESGNGTHSPLAISQTMIPAAVCDVAAKVVCISSDFQQKISSEPASSRSKAAHHPVSDSLDPQGIWLAGQAAAAAQRRDLAYIRRLRRRHENSDRQRARAAGPPAGGAAARGKLGGASAAPY